jgi:hypothetical protein
MCHLRGKLALGQGERPIDDNHLLYLTALRNSGEMSSTIPGASLGEHPAGRCLDST